MPGYMARPAQPAGQGAQFADGKTGRQVCYAELLRLDLRLCVNEQNYSRAVLLGIIRRSAKETRHSMGGR
jgi:hypothetical protein